MFLVTISGQLKEVKKLNVSKKEKYAAVAVLRHWATDERGGYEQFWLVYLPQYLVAFAEIKRSKGYSVVVQADLIAGVPVGIPEFAKYEPRWCISATAIYQV